MFGKNIKDIDTEPTPQRVYELGRILLNFGPMTEAELKDLMEPKVLNPSGSVYFGKIRNVATELKLIQVDGESLKCIAEKSTFESMDNFRKYCNSFVLDDKKSAFYLLLKCCLESNEVFLKEKSFTSHPVIEYIKKHMGINSLDPDNLRGFRFWADFLGFGYFTESPIIFLPNMYLAMSDYIEATSFEKGREYTVLEFINILPSCSTVATEGSLEKKVLNLAFSNAVRQLHDEKKLELKRNLDSKDVWNLYKSTSHEFYSEITHIVVMEA